MRSSKSRSRSKSSRNRPSGGNVVNRVFDSSGPEGKVRGTPQQIIEKYNQLARDAQLANDRVAAENFQQHAEHYLRMLGEAQREQDQRREQQENENRQRQSDRDRERAQRQERESGDAANASEQPSEPASQPAPQPAAQASTQPAGADSSGDVIENGAEEESGLVETPEDRASTPKPPRSRSPRSKAKPAQAAEGEASGEEAPKPKKRTYTRKKKADADAPANGELPLGNSDTQAAE